jgi:hypothetical protein
VNNLAARTPWLTDRIPLVLCNPKRCRVYRSPDSSGVIVIEVNDEPSLAFTSDVIDERRQITAEFGLCGSPNTGRASFIDGGTGVLSLTWAVYTANLTKLRAPRALAQLGFI